MFYLTCCLTDLSFFTYFQSKFEQNTVFHILHHEISQMLYFVVIFTNFILLLFLFLRYFHIFWKADTDRQPLPEICFYRHLSLFSIEQFQAFIYICQSNML